MHARVITLPLTALLLVTLTACAGGGSAPDDAPAPAAGCSYTESPGGVRDVSAPPAEPTVTGMVAATLQTSAGDLPLTLDADRAPCTVGSFISLADQDYYSDTPCHRLTTSGIFVLQCGDPSGTGRGGPGYAYGDELDGTEKYPAGTIAMANAGADTNGSQFFLVYEDTDLPPSYTVFGELSSEGLEVVRQIAAEGVDGGLSDGPPAMPITITGVIVG